MGITKMSLANIQGKLSRTEMKNIMAGSAGCNGHTDCWGATLLCNGTYYPATVICRNHKCVYTVVC